MKYYIQRQLQEYGPYTLADIQRYVAAGNILLTDLCRSEGMTDWVPVSQVIGNIAAPAPAPAMPVAGGTVYGGPAVYGAAPAYGGVTPYGTTPAMTAGPVPPDFHWALVLLIGFCTCFLFFTVWAIVEFAWVRKIKPQSKGLLLLLLGIASTWISVFINLATRNQAAPFTTLLTLGGYVLIIVANFSVRSDLEDYYNTVEPINLRLSGVMTFFFAIFYFQHHFSRIAKWKKTGVLQPQG
jgi:GYF domain 2